MSRTRRRRGFAAALLRFVRRLLSIVLALLAAYCLACGAALVLLRAVDPPTTTVQTQRRIESWLDDRPYTKRYAPVNLDGISDQLEHAVVAAEDARFFEHHGVDWKAIRQAREDNLGRGRAWRGGSTITQQLVKNLFLTTHSSYARKVLELPLAYMAELVLPKERILELYLNVIEWDRGIYGAEAAARHHYGTSAASLDRAQAAGLAACIPSPRRYRPERMTAYRERILERMAQMGY
jgi:monofunctional biosynthetic peptidoglycan transglycosylase